MKSIVALTVALALAGVALSGFALLLFQVQVAGGPMTLSRESDFRLGGSERLTVIPPFFLQTLAFLALGQVLLGLSFLTSSLKK